VTRSKPILLCAATICLAGCAAAPRAPAANLADAGLKATASFSSEVGEVADQLNYISVTEAFTRTWDLCGNPALCSVSQEKVQTTGDRRDLANVVGLRSEAIDALGAAYSALKAEAAYDGGADLADAVDKAVGSAAAFADAAASAAGAPAFPALSTGVKGLIGFGATLLGEKRQRDRLLAANHDSLSTRPTGGRAASRRRDAGRRTAHSTRSIP
jgi:hypothetical protein